MITRKLNRAAIIVLAIIILAGVMFSSGCKIVSVNDDSKSQDSSSNGKTTSTTDRPSAESNSNSDSSKNNNSNKNAQDNSSQSANRVQGDYSWPNGDKYHGQLLNGLPDGTGTLILWNVATDRDWDCYVGEWKAGKINGYGKMELGTDGAYYEGNFKDNLPNGEGELFAPENGREPKSGRWTTAKKNGYWYSTSDNGLSFYPLVPGE